MWSYVKLVVHVDSVYFMLCLLFLSVVIVFMLSLFCFLLDSIFVHIHIFENDTCCLEKDKNSAIHSEKKQY